MMNHCFRFKDWPIYREARIFRKDIYDLIKKLPKEKMYALSASCLDCAVDSQYMNLEEYSMYTKKAENLAKQFNDFISHLSKTA